MPHPLLEISEIDEPPAAYVARCGEVFRTFGAPEQDSGNLSYGVRRGHERYFVKTVDQAADVLLDFDARVQLLHNAVQIAETIRSDLQPELLNVVQTPAGPMLVYRWVEGELLRRQADKPDSAHERFRRLPVNEITNALTGLFALHAQLASAGWIACDFYDGCLIYDFQAEKLSVVDLDHYQQGPFRNEMGRMFGSTRFMAPEEFDLGAMIDGRSTVFSLGRAALIFLGDGSTASTAFRGTSGQYQAARRACLPEPEQRYPSVTEFCAAWTS